ncbi:hypothetical protein ACFV9C_06895 [Kribbella sp. NPDC059898]|uniref:hypothetical protein n=1 Tax=Kribbella sp. NPDC059898 TaxID=3346995 RepID=UPI0036481D8D
MATAELSLVFQPSPYGGREGGRWERRTLYCYAAECLVRRLRDLAEVQRTAYRASTERGYQLGPLFVEEDESGRAMHALMDAVADHKGAAAVAVPHRGHLIPLGRPRVWEWLLEELTDHPLVFTSRAP